MMESVLLPNVYYPDDTGSVGRCKLEEFVKHEQEHPLDPLPLPTVIELPSRHRYLYTPTRDSKGVYTYTFERIEKYD